LPDLQGQRQTSQAAAQNHHVAVRGGSVHAVSILVG